MLRHREYRGCADAGKDRENLLLRFLASIVLLTGITALCLVWVFRPDSGAAVGFFVLALGLAEFYGVAMPLPWIVTGVLVSGLLAIAAPPVPGGSLTCYTVLLMQLGIPEEAIGLAVAGNMILDFFMTACGISCLQSELVLSSNRLGMLDAGTLRGERRE